MRYPRKFTEEKILYFANTNEHGVHVALTERKDTTLSGLVKSLTGRKMIELNEGVTVPNDGRYYRTTPLGQLYLKLMQTKYAEETKRTGAYMWFADVAELAFKAFGEELHNDVNSLLSMAEESSLRTKEHKGEVAMTMINRMSLVLSMSNGETFLNPLGQILLKAMRNEAMVVE